MPDMSFVGPGEYDDVVVEIDCLPAFTAVVRNEGGKFLLEIFNLNASQIEDFANGRKVVNNSVDLDSLLDAFEKAKAGLAYQSVPKT